MGEVLVIMGGFSVIYGAYDILSYDSNTGTNWKSIAAKIFGGIIITGFGLAMRHFGI